MSKTILVTGINGFVGKHLAKEIKNRGFNVLGAGMESDPHPEIAGDIDRYFSCDLTKSDDVKKLPLKDLDAIISLAGMANVGDSFNQPDLYKKINVEVLTKLCDELMGIGSKARVIAISTGALYDPNQPMPLTEDSATQPGTSPYAESKLLMEQAALDYKQRGLDSVIVRPFNHSGPGQLGGFLIPDLCQKIISAKSTGETVTVGNLKTKRDYTDVRDVVRAYVSLATADNLSHDLYNVCSGVSRSGEEVLDLLKQAAGAQSIEIKTDEKLLRPNDPSEIYGSYARLKNDTGWSPEIDFQKTINDFVASVS